MLNCIFLQNRKPERFLLKKFGKMKTIFAFFEFIPTLGVTVVMNKEHYPNKDAGRLSGPA